MRGWIAVWVVLGCGCAAEVASGPEDRAAEPVVGKLKTRNGTIDLTVGSFAKERGGVPREAVAVEVMADVDVDKTQDKQGDALRR
jgi:hypothetical protein